MLRKFLFSFIVAALVAGGATSAFAYTSPGAPLDYVNDFANVLSDETEATLETLLAEVEATSTSEIAVVTVPTHGTDETIESYAVKLFEEYGIGQAKEDNGVLLLIAVEDKTLRIEVGYGLEGALPDFIAQSIIDNEMVPFLRSGDFDSAVTTGVSKIQEAIAGEYVAHNAAASTDNSGWFELLIYALFIIPQWFVAVVARSKEIWAGGIFGALFGGVVWFVLASAGIAGLFMGASLFAFFTALGFLLDYYISKSYKEHTSRGDSIPWWAGGSSGGSGGSSSGGGSFGGGSSGGGGASGSW